MRKEVKTTKAALDAIKGGQAISITGMIALTLTNVASADIIVMSGAYLNLTLGSSQATVKTLGSSQATVMTLGISQATVKTLGSSQATVKTLGSSQATVMTLGSSQATVMTLGSSQATVMTLDSSQATVMTLDSSQATVETLDSSQATVMTLDSSQATVETLDSSQATVETWGSRSPLPDNITRIGGEEVATGTPDLMRQVAQAALASPDALVMNDWNCGTSHCIAGWAVHLAGERGAALASRLGYHGAGLVLLGRDAAAHFYDGADERDPTGPGHQRARAFLSQFLPAEPAS